MRSQQRTTRPTMQRHRRGAAVVEFAIVAPLFLLLLAGIIEFGQAFRIQHVLSNAARRGTRAAIIEKATTDNVKQLVRTQVKKTLGINEADVNVVITVNGVSGATLIGTKRGDEIGVSVGVPFSKAGANFYANMFSNATLSSTSILEHE